MMGIYIEGMEMPKSCHECIAGYGGLCFVAPAESDAICQDNGRADFCPIIPAADVERKKGEWIFKHRKKNGVYSEWCECSVCGETATAGACYYNNETPFCPWCGADMRGEEYGQTDV